MSKKKNKANRLQTQHSNKNKQELAVQQFTVDKLDAALWEGNNLDRIKQVYKKENITDAEFETFLQMGKATGLNPFLKEIWCIKYDSNKPAQILISRDGCRRIAQRHPEYRGCNSYAVYKNDIYYNNAVKGLEHSPVLIEQRGPILGAFCIVKRLNTDDTHIFVNFSEYDQKNSIWRTKPETMIKKCSEAQALRAAFCELFAGTYFEEELPDNMTQEQQVPNNKKQTRTEQVKNIINIVDDSLATDIQLEHISKLIEEVQFPEERIVAALEYYKVDNLKKLSFDNANGFIKKLCIVKDKQSQAS